MRKQRTLKKVEAWIRENKEEMSSDASVYGPEDDVRGTLTHCEDVLAIGDKTEERPAFDLDQILAKCADMNMTQLTMQYDSLTKVSDVNEELIVKSEQINLQQDRMSEEVMERNEAVQNERAKWQAKVAEAVKRHTLFKNESRRLQRRHRCNEVESEIIDQFHENVKPEIRVLFDEIKESKEKLALSIESTDDNIERIRKEVEALIDDNCNSFESLARLKKELNDLKIGLLDKDTEHEDLDDENDVTNEAAIGQGDNASIEKCTDKSSDNNDKMLAESGSKKATDKIINDVRNSLSSRCSPLAKRSISPETDKILRTVEVNDIATGYSRLPFGNNEPDFTEGQNSTKKDAKSISVIESDSLSDTNVRTKTKIPKPTKMSSRSASRYDDRRPPSTPKPNKLLPKNYYTREKTDKTQSVGNTISGNKEGCLENTESVDTKPKQPDTKGSDSKLSVKVRGMYKPKDNINSVDAAPKLKLPPIVSKVKTDTKTSIVPKLPPIVPKQDKLVPKPPITPRDRKTQFTRSVKSCISTQNKLPPTRDFKSKSSVNVDMKTGTAKSDNHAVALNSSRTRAVEDRPTVPMKKQLPPVRMPRKATRKCAQLNNVCFAEALPPITNQALPNQNKDNVLPPIPWIHSNKYSDLTPRDVKDKQFKSSDDIKSTNQSAAVVNIIGQAKALNRRKR